MYLPAAPHPPCVAAFGPAFNSTVLVFAVPPTAGLPEGAERSTATSEMSSGTGAPAPHPVVTIAVADIGAVYSAARARGWLCSVFHPGADDAAVSFTCLDADGNMLHVVPL